MVSIVLKIFMPAHASTRMCDWIVTAIQNKVLTTTVISPLDCDLSAFTHLRLWGKIYDCFIASLHSQPVGPKMCSIDILVDLQPEG